MSDHLKVTAGDLSSHARRTAELADKFDQAQAEDATPVQIEITTGALTVLLSGPKRDAYEAAHAFACFDCPEFETPKGFYTTDGEINFEAIP